MHLIIPCIMSTYFRQFSDQFLRVSALLTRSRKPEPDYFAAKEFFRFRITVKTLIKNVFLVSLGILSAGFGLKGFLLPNNFIDGGATGISLLISEVSGFPLPGILILVNIPFIILGYTQISKTLAMKSILAIIGLAIVVATLDYPVITSDKLLVATFGGFFLGAGIGLAIRGGGVLDGTEVLAIQVSKKIGLTIGQLTRDVNIIIATVAA